MIVTRGLGRLGITKQSLVSAGIGLWLAVAPVQPVEAYHPPTAPSGGHHRYESGVGFVREGHTWVEIRSFSRVGLGSPNDFKVESSSGGGGKSSGVKVTSFEGWTHANIQVQLEMSSLAFASLEGATETAIDAGSLPDTFRVRTAEGKVEWLSIDELLMLLEETR